MNTYTFLGQRLVAIVVLERPDDAVPLAEALLAGGLKIMEIPFRTAKAAGAIVRVRKETPAMAIGAGTLLTADNVKQAVDAGAQFGVSPGLSESVLAAAHQDDLPMFPGVVTPTEITRALDLGCDHVKFFPAEAAGGVATLKALAGPFAHTGLKFIPTGGINATSLAEYLALPQVAAVGGSWMAERKLVADRAWSKITALTADALKLAAPVGDDVRSL